MAIDHLSRFAKLLRSYRVEAGMTQEELAERAGLSARAISDLERGVKTRPHRVTVESLADSLELSTADRAAFIAAVPRATAAGMHPASPLPDWLDAAFRQARWDVQPGRSSGEMRRDQQQEVAGISRAEDPARWQVNVTVILVSPASVMTGMSAVDEIMA